MVAYMIQTHQNLRFCDILHSNWTPAYTSEGPPLEVEILVTNKLSIMGYYSCRASPSEFVTNGDSLSLISVHILYSVVVC